MNFVLAEKSASPSGIMCRSSDEHSKALRSGCDISATAHALKMSFAGPVSTMNKAVYCANSPRETCSVSSGLHGVKKHACLGLHDAAAPDG